MSGFVGAGRLRHDQQQCVVELNVGVTELEALEQFAALAVGGAVEVARSRALDDGVGQHTAISHARQV